jgi:hypothetical protein
MKLSKLIGFSICILLIVAVAGCIGNKTSTTSNQSVENVSSSAQPTQATDDATTINPANATLLPENDTTIVVNATIANDTNDSGNLS